MTMAEGEDCKEVESHDFKRRAWSWQAVGWLQPKAGMIKPTSPRGSVLILIQINSTFKEDGSLLYGGVYGAKPKQVALAKCGN
jgi:hypothetical protein